MFSKNGKSIFFESRRYWNYWFFCVFKRKCRRELFQGMGSIEGRVSKMCESQMNWFIWRTLPNNFCWYAYGSYDLHPDWELKKSVKTHVWVSTCGLCSIIHFKTGSSSESLKTQFGGKVNFICMQIRKVSLKAPSLRTSGGNQDACFFYGVYL